MIAGDYIKDRVSSNQVGVTVKLRDLLALLRAKQWTKNLIVFVPVLFAARIHDVATLGRVSLCFTAFCMVSSSVYVINDLFDLKQDGNHPVKSKRPIAAGQISVGSALITAFLCAVSGLALLSTISIPICLIALLYIVLMLAYNLVLKKYALLDVFTISTGFVLRAIAGAMAVPVLPSGWFLLCTSFGALFVALDKRRQELKVLQDQAGNHRPTLNNYSLPLLNRMESIIVPCLLSCYVLFSMLSYHGQAMLLTVPFVAYGVLRYQWVAEAKPYAGMPEDILIRDRPIQIAILLWLITSATVLYRHGL